MLQLMNKKIFLIFALNFFTYVKVKDFETYLGVLWIGVKKFPTPGKEKKNILCSGSERKYFQGKIMGGSRGGGTGGQDVP